MEDTGCCISTVRFSILVDGAPDWFSFSVVLVGYVRGILDSFLCLLW